MKVILFLGLVISNLYSYCQPSNLFEQANQSYTIGKYEEAIAQYEEVIDEPFNQLLAQTLHLSLMKEIRLTLEDKINLTNWEGCHLRNGKLSQLLSLIVYGQR